MMENNYYYDDDDDDAMIYHNRCFDGSGPGSPSINSIQWQRSNVSSSDDGGNMVVSTEHCGPRTIFQSWGTRSDDDGH